MEHGFVRVAAAVPELKVADCGFNTDKILELIREAEEAGVQFVVFPELSLTAYTCGDLFHQQLLVKEALGQLTLLAEKTASLDIVAIVGLPVLLDNQQFNCAAVLQKGEILGLVPKTYIPGYKEFYEERWFAPGSNALSREIEIAGTRVPFGTDLLFEAAGPYNVCFGVEICEDLWTPVPPSSYQAVAGATLLFNLSASNEIIGKYEYRRELVRQQSGKCVAGYVYTSAGVHESTTDVVYGGHALIAENGGLLCESERFQRKSCLIISEIDVQKLQNDRIKNTSFMEGLPGCSFRKIGFRLGAGAGEAAKLNRFIDPHPFVPSDPAARDIRCREIFAIQTAGLAKRLAHTGMQYAVVGISGGLDSTLALLVTARTFDMLHIPRANIIAITMPGFGTTDATYANALQLIRSMGAELHEINIRQACLQHFADIGHDPAIHDVTYENVQARERTQILMDIANKRSGLVIGTGDLSELALGWCTYNGDHMSMYSVNCSIPKTLVKYLVRWAADNVTDQAAADVLLRILDTPITPELLPPDENGGIRQKTEELVGPYELHDFFLYHTLRYGAPPRKVLFLAEQAFGGGYGAEEIKSWLKVFYKRFFSQQFKRSCLPDGPKVGTISLSPRGDWRMPSDAAAALWLKELE
jgi:NAD+ synthase (glutamine-hydrolysing)